ncbi:MAG: hypothetical protein ACJA1P_001907 [Maribacter sp.]
MSDLGASDRNSIPRFYNGNFFFKRVKARKINEGKLFQFFLYHI